MQHQLALHSIFNYVSHQELFTCALVSVEWNQYATLKLWRTPKFGNDSKTALKSFQSFLEILLNTAREQARLCVFTIDVNEIQESLYETVNENWLGIVVLRCPNLRELIIRDVSFLSTIQIRYLCNMKVPNFVETLDLTGAKDVTESTMKALVQNFTELKRITLDNCSGVTDGSISQIAYYCHNLEYVNIANSRSSFTDVGIYALAKFGKQKLKGIELTASMKVTSDAIIAMSSHCTKLESINFSKCALITIQGLEKIVTSNKNTLKQLIIHHMRSIPSLTYSFLDLLANHCPQLMTLSFSFTSITDIKIELLNDIFDKFKTLRDLIIYDCPEHVFENTTNFSLWRLIEKCKPLKKVTIYRTSYESDFILGGYARTLGSINQQAVDEFNVFHPGIKVNLLLLEE
ncbi:15373_t:CDS:1 [Funneliformis caledonium]|uniref:15373_t:CDS:1 n=1 Tax=Funneliformis caledonium TaxID=1117310 RepID=A0A9N9FL27_9GLOM|nr:15373_t:CDS:1 [Funneliformis caledonium]